MLGLAMYSILCCYKVKIQGGNVQPNVEHLFHSHPNP